MAQMQQLLNSMTPEQRAQLQELANSLLDDMDLRWQMDQLGQNLRNAFPQMGWGQRHARSAATSRCRSSGWAALLDQLGDIDALENLMRNATNPGQLAEVDLDQVRELLGDDAARSLAAALRAREDARGGRPHRAARRPHGAHAEGHPPHRPARARRSLPAPAAGPRRAGTRSSAPASATSAPTTTRRTSSATRSTSTSVARSTNAITRQGAGTPVRITPDDFEIERTEQVTRTATVLMLDVSLSMEMRGRFLAAKKVAMALHALITSQFPRDYLGMVSFGRVAREVKPERLPEATWDFEWGTNMQHALMLARTMLPAQSGRKQIIMITDGEPTAHIDERLPVLRLPARRRARSR